MEMLAASSSRSAKPAIFGAAPAPDDQQRRPLGSAREGDAVALEVAAAEMAQAAANLVAIERSIMSITEKGVGLLCTPPFIHPCSCIAAAANTLRCMLTSWHSGCWTGSSCSLSGSACEAFIFEATQGLTWTFHGEDLEGL